MMDDVRCVFWDGFWMFFFFGTSISMDQVAIRDFNLHEGWAVPGVIELQAWSLRSEDQMLSVA